MIERLRWTICDSCRRASRSCSAASSASASPGNGAPRSNNVKSIGTARAYRLGTETTIAWQAPLRFWDSRILGDHLDAEFLQLLRRDRSRSIHHQVLGLLVHREKDHLADVGLVGDQ